MSLLGGSAHSDSPASLNVHGCAVGRKVENGAVAAGFHCRLTGQPAKTLLQAMEKLVADRAAKTDRYSEDVKVSGEKLTMHCTGSSNQLLYVVVTRADYPRRIVFGRADADALEAAAVKGGLLPQLASETFDLVGLALAQAPAGATGVLVRVQLPTRATQAMERVCSDFESPAAHDSVASLQAQVQEVNSVMSDNVNQILQNSEQLSILNEKADLARSNAGAFSDSAKAARRKAQWEDFKMRAVLGCGVLIVVLFLVWWFFG